MKLVGTLRSLVSAGHGPAVTAVLFGLLLATFTKAAWSADEKYCGKEGVWLQILGSGGAELDDRRSSAAYIIWLDGVARLLVDAGPGTSVRFDESGAKLEDLDVVALTQMHADHTGGLTGFVVGAQFGRRDRPLPIYGPNGNEFLPSTTELVQRLFGPKGAHPLLADYLTYKEGSFRIKAHNVSATGSRPGLRFSNDHLRLYAIPVDHGPIPALAWRVEIGGHKLVFTGDFNNNKNVIPEFAKDADALIVSHVIAEVARGRSRSLHVRPSQIGRIAKQANARMLVLGQRLNRTRGRESQTREAIEQNYAGPQIYANELECWGM